jgi:hypothetical protein
MNRVPPAEVYQRTCNERGVRPSAIVTQQLEKECGTIDLALTYIGPRGAGCVAATLRAAPQVQHVRFGANQIGNEETKSICTALAAAPHLLSADFSDNPAISAAGGRSLVRLARAHGSIVVIAANTNVPAALRHMLSRSRTDLDIMQSSALTESRGRVSCDSFSVDVETQSGTTTMNAASTSPTHEMPNSQSSWASQMSDVTRRGDFPTRLALQTVFRSYIASTTTNGCREAARPIREALLLLMDAAAVEA